MKKRKTERPAITNGSVRKTTSPKERFRERVHAGRGRLKGSGLLKALAAAKKIERDL